MADFMSTRPQIIAGHSASEDARERAYDTASRVYPTCGGKYQVGFTRLAVPSITELGQAEYRCNRSSLKRWMRGS